MMLIFRGEMSFGEMCVLRNTQEYLDSLIWNTQWDLMPSHNKEAKVFGDQIVDKCLELNDSDVEILENLSSELTVNTTEEKVPKALKPVVKLERIKQEVKSEFRPVGFSNPKHQGAAKYNRALKAVVKAKKERASLDVKKESSQCRTQLIMSGTLRPAMIANKAFISKRELLLHVSSALKFKPHAGNTSNIENKCIPSSFGFVKCVPGDTNPTTVVTNMKNLMEISN